MVLWSDIAKLRCGRVQKGAIIQNAEKKSGIWHRKRSCPTGCRAGLMMCVNVGRRFPPPIHIYIIEVLESGNILFSVESTDGNAVPRFFAEHVSDTFTFGVDALGINFVSLDEGVLDRFCTSLSETLVDIGGTVG